MSGRLQLPDRIATDRIVVVLRADDGRHVDAAADALVAVGLGCLEVTFTIPEAAAVVERLAQRYGDRACVGAGTVTTVDRAEAAVRAGAAYLVSPTSDSSVAGVARAAGVPYLPGALTPTEISAAWAAGACAVKLFPAATVGPAYVKAVHGPMPEIPLLPSGGVDVGTAAAWLDAGAVAVSVGGELLGDALHGGSLEALRGRAHELVAAVARGRGSDG